MKTNNKIKEMKNENCDINKNNYKLPYSNLIQVDALYSMKKLKNTSQQCYESLYKERRSFNFISNTD